MREPLLAPLAGIVAGVLFTQIVPFSTPELWVLLALFAVLAMGAKVAKAQWLALGCCLASFVSAGALLSVVHRPGPAPELDVSDGEPVVLGGCVVEPAVVARNREQFTLEIAPGARARVNWYLRDGETAPNFQYGQQIEFPAKTRKPHNYRNPGSFDYIHFLARQSVYWTASTPAGAEATFLPGRCGSRFWQVIYGIRTAALQRIEELYGGDRYTTAMMEAILIGETSGLERVWTEDFRSTGTFHALVISGSHVAVLAAFLLFLLRICFVPQSYAMFATVMAAWLYACITGWQAPVIRSAAGMTIFAIARLFYREGRLLNILAAVALLFVVADPEEIFDASFQLSFLSVGLIAAFAIPLIEKTSGPYMQGFADLSDTARDLAFSPRTAQFRVELRLAMATLQLIAPWLPAWAAQLIVALPLRIFFYFYELILTSAVIQVGLALPMAIYFHRVSFSGLSANALVVPLLGIVVPVGFLALFLNSTLLAQLAAWLLELSRITVAWHSRWEPNWRIADPPLWLAFGFAAALIFAAIRFRSKWVRIGSAALVLGLLAILVAHPFAPVLQSGVMEMTAIDVGQGDSLLIAFPDRRLMLIDGGGIPAFGRQSKTRLDIGEDVVAPYLWKRSIRHLDVVALSHAHEDHIGGLAAILNNFDVGELWTGATPSSPAWDHLLQEARDRKIPVRHLQGGQPFPYGGATVQVLAPTADYHAGRSPKNNDSLVLRLRYGRHAFLLTGDVEKQIEQQLLENNLVLHSDVLKVGHHGSRTSSTPSFLDAVHPALAVISVGFENSYGHPNQQTMESLGERKIPAFRTDQKGLITVRTDGRYLSVEP